MELILLIIGFILIAEWRAKSQAKIKFYKEQLKRMQEQ
jgi:hypothetical protein